MSIIEDQQGEQTSANSTGMKQRRGAGFGEKAKPSEEPEQTKKAPAPIPAESMVVQPQEGTRIWFEKTVEYGFALRYLTVYNIICPLAGIHERAGDTILGNKSLWCLIEFKREKPLGKERPTSELVKFQGDKKAKDELAKYREKKTDDLKFHHVVYGSNCGEQIDLGACDYWKNDKDRVIDDLLTKFSVEEQPFFEYVKLFVRAKGGAKRGRPPKGGEGGGKNGGDPTPNRDDKGPKGGGNVRTEEVEADLQFTNVLGITVEGEGKGKIFFAPLLACYDVFLSNDADPPASEVATDGGPRPGPNSDFKHAPFTITVNAPTMNMPDLNMDSYFVRVNRPEEA